MFISGLIGWLIQEVGGSAVRKMGDPVRRALEQAVRDALAPAAAQVYSDTERREHAIASLLECPVYPVPCADGVPLAQLTTAVRVWVASIEYPVGADGLPEQVADHHPLVEPLCTEILNAIRKEAIFGLRILQPLWNEYVQAVGQEQIERQIRDLQVDLRDVGRSVTDARSQPTRIEYWHVPVARAPGFIGRAKELARLTDNGDLHLIHGIGGVGKTALAVEHASRLPDRYPDGRLFIDFQSYSVESGRRPMTADQALAEVLPLCGLDDRQVAGMSPQQRETTWKQTIAGRRLVFVWDNVADVEQIRPLLSGQPGCLTLITSRAELDLPGVHRMPLGPLVEDDAISLFETIAGTDNCTEDADLVSEAARLCARMPLQIGVHAASVRRRRTLAELVSELRSLPSGERLATLFASLDLSYQNLGPDEQRALRVLGSHPGPHLTAGTAAAMLSCSVTEAVRLLDELVATNFADRYRGSFDRYSGGVEIPAERDFYAYVTHDLLRDYAHAKATSAAAEMWPTAGRLLDYYRDWTRRHDNRLPAWVQAERTCLLATLRLPLPSKTVQRMALDFGQLLAEFGWYPDAEAAYWVALGRSWTMHDRVGEAEAWTGLSECAAVRADYRQSRMLQLLALAIHRDRGDRSAVAQALLGLAHACKSLGELDTASGYLQEALAIHREHGDTRAEAKTKCALLELQAIADDYQLTPLRQEWARLAKLGRDLGDRRIEADARLNLAILAIDGSDEHAVEGLQRAHRLYLADGHRHGQANALYHLGLIALHHDDADGTLNRLTEAMSIYREIGDTIGELKTIILLGDVALNGPEIGPAEALFRTAHKIARSTDSRLWQAIVLHRLAAVAVRTGDRCAACTQLRAALDLVPPKTRPETQIRRALAELGCAG
ncbi:MAG TPA: NB-ARC domain-containing protein [Actinophytocola sp.]|uniref:NB-ARC domain-containing protein n=1 Tax=Actinophytocola sp. TaxID=1872138 RepID=UPI002DB696C0|nr:NB-ARC domain-containing protein [Actinophytocola sp.]HEU5470891.1 NB-ARC domain-containing protein [Actinophytocola sp.]